MVINIIGTRDTWLKLNAAILTNSRRLSGQEDF